MFGRSRERNGLIIREEIGQLGKQQEERKKVVSRSRQRLFRLKIDFRNIFFHETYHQVELVSVVVVDQMQILGLM